eukprot:TRINITY_DN4046_c0_g1_i3.p1 TRINITY_DN4046_c0_g1~~TRINITY_DN4046_c0_g1_i3.p1  ORF type:complete len:380 (-),score=51.98 TRINITY_DN4046_c0_g1_i3:1200-2243(-)
MSGVGMLSISGAAAACVLLALVLSILNSSALSLNEEEKGKLMSADAEDSLAANDGLLAFFQSAIELKRVSQPTKPSAMVIKQTTDESTGIASALACDSVLVKSFGHVESGSVNELLVRGGQTRGVKSESEHMSDQQTGFPTEIQETVTGVLRVILRAGILMIFVDALFRLWSSTKAASDHSPDAIYRGEKTEDTFGRTALHNVVATSSCVEKGTNSSLSSLLQKGAKVNVCDSHGETPLHYAARQGSTRDCELLLAYGAQINAPNVREKTPLVIAAEEARHNVCTFLMGHGAGIGSLSERDLASLPLFFQKKLEEQRAINVASELSALQVDDSESVEGCEEAQSEED